MRPATTTPGTPAVVMKSVSVSTCALGPSTTKAPSTSGSLDDPPLPAADDPPLPAAAESSSSPPQPTSPPDPGPTAAARASATTTERARPRPERARNAMTS